MPASSAPSAGVVLIENKIRSRESKQRKTLGINHKSQSMFIASAMIIVHNHTFPEISCMNMLLAPTGAHIVMMCHYIQLLESPIPTPTPTTSQKASSADISGTKPGWYHRSAGIKTTRKKF